MNPSDILLELRDIHLPHIAEKAEPLAFDPRQQQFSIFGLVSHLVERLTTGLVHSVCRK